MVCSYAAHSPDPPLPPSLDTEHFLDACTSCSAIRCRGPRTAQRRHSATPRSQHNIFGSIGGLAGASATIQVDFRIADGKPLPYATVKGKGPEPEKHPLFTNHDTVMGDVRTS